MSKSNENNPHVVSLWIGEPAAGEFPGAYVRKKAMIKSVALINSEDLAADNTDYVTVQLLDGPGGSVLVEIDTRAAKEGALTANVAKVAPETEVEVAAGSSLVVKLAYGGAGDLSDARLQVEMYKV